MAQRVWASAGVASDSEGDTDSNNTDNGNGPTDTAAVGDGDGEVGGDFGFGISGSVAFNWVKQDALASIRDVVTVVAGNTVQLEADSNPLLVAAAGAFAFGNDQLAIGGSYAQNDLNQTTAAFTENANITSTTLGIQAHADSTVLGIVASGAIADEDIGVAGGVSFNNLENDVFAFVGNGATINAVDVYPLMMEILGLPVTTPIDGDPEQLVPLLIKE